MAKERVLVVDDEEGVRNSLRNILRDENYTVRAVAPGASELSLTCSCGNVRLANATVHVDVRPAVATP